MASEQEKPFLQFIEPGKSEEFGAWLRNPVIGAKKGQVVGELSQCSM